tara:strand:- start:120 stop:395 length:276 start_codon:yes stop_codon:yes gene_type:complete
MDKRVPTKLKIVPLLAIVYTFLPTDLIPDFFPIIGWIDDLLILIISVTVFLGLGSFSIISKGNSEGSETKPYEVIPGQYRVVDHDDKTASE